MRLSFTPAVRFGNNTLQPSVTIDKAQKDLVNLLMGVSRYGVNSIGSTGKTGTPITQGTVLTVSLQGNKYEQRVIDAIVKNGGTRTPHGTAMVGSVPVPSQVSYKGFPVILYSAGGKAVPTKS